MTLRAGDLNRRIKIQQRQTGSDAAGQPLDGWDDVVDVWSKILGQSGIHAITSLQGGVATSITRYSFRIRYREGITSAMRVLYNSEPFDITSVQMDNNLREWTDLVCELGGNNG